jgi:hypothetical protein
VYHFIWDGVDTVIHTAISETDDTTFGLVFIYTKLNGEWTMTQQFSALDMGFIGYAYLGLEVHQLDKDNVLVSASLDDVTDINAFFASPIRVGSALLLHRNATGEWDFTLRIKSAEVGILGFGIRSNDYDILIYQCTFFGNAVNCSISTVPQCFRTPQNVTCNDIQLDDCSFELDLSALYTVNNPQCGETTTSFSAISYAEDKFTVDFTVSRVVVDDVTCRAVLSCPAPPVTAAPVSVPVATPAVSSGMRLAISALALIVSAILV